MPTLHVVIPVYNERNTLSPCVRRVLASPLPAGWDVKIQLIDDRSDDAHFPAVEALARALEHEHQPITLHRHEVNRGKGAALQTGFDVILSLDSVNEDDLVIIQDADLEYDPDDYSRLMQPLIDGKADAVLGTRWGDHRVLPTLKHRIHAMGNGLLTLLSNIMTGYRVSDMECCYKVVPVRTLRRLRPLLSEQRFGIEPQYVAGLARLRARVAEVPVNYDPRGLAEGKKIGWRDGVRALVVIARERFRNRAQANPTASRPTATASKSA
jgi:glycosyltransferase involved in cell wall biosynthesis